VEVLAGKIGERSVWLPGALGAAANYIRTTWGSLGFDVTAQGYEAKGVWSENLEVEIHGGARADEIVIVGAHYDTAAGTPGADDNGSGVAAVLELARLLRDLRPSRTLRLVAFVNEEPPFFFFGNMGSKVYAKAARARGDEIRVMLSLEMLGFYSDRSGSQGYPPFLGWFYPDRGNFIGFVSNLRSRRVLREFADAFASVSDFPLQKLSAPALLPGVAWSDQLSFWREGYPAVMVTDTAFHRNPHYHRSTDTPDTLDYDSMAKVVEGLAGAVALLAGTAACSASKVTSSW
jgi:Zn-dependent M28 family amino/carboxypeptidase